MLHPVHVRVTPLDEQQPKPERRAEEGGRRRRRPSGIGGVAQRLLWVLVLLLAMGVPDFVLAVVSSAAPVDLYKVLDLSPNATPEQIKKAHRTAVLKWHPDKNAGPDRKKAEEKFKEAQQAYETLSDRRARADYDLSRRRGRMWDPTGGSQGGNPSSAGGGGGAGRAASQGTPMSFEEAFQKAFFKEDFTWLFPEQRKGGGGKTTTGRRFCNPFTGQTHYSRTAEGGGGGGVSGAGQASERPMPYPFNKERAHLDAVTFNLKCTLEELCSGTVKQMKVKNSPWQRCVQAAKNGLLSDLLAEAAVLLTYGVFVARSSGLNVIMILKRLGTVGGLWGGGLLFLAAVLFQAHQTLPTLPEGVFNVKVTPGWKAGTKITYRKTSGADVVFVVSELEHAVFEREGDDLHVTVRVKRAKAKRGGDVMVPTVDQGRRKVQLRKGQVRDGYTMAIEGLGMPIKGGPKRGKLQVRFVVR